MTDRRPAWSAPFAADALQSVRSIQPIDEITPEWAWGGSTGKGVKVAVIDSGIDATHPAVDGQVAGYVAIEQGPDGLLYDTQPHEDAYGHGNACAGIIRTVAPDCELYSVKVLGPVLRGRGLSFAAGLRWAMWNSARPASMSASPGTGEVGSPPPETASQRPTSPALSRRSWGSTRGSPGFR